MTLQVRASSRTTHRTFQCSIPEPIRSWRKYPKHQSIAVEPAVEPLQVHHATDTEHHDQYQTRTARACVLPVPHAGGQNADKASEAARPVPCQGHGVVHASGAPGDRERPTGRALPQAERRATPQEMGKGADVAPAAPEVRERGPRATECATAGRGVATRGAARKRIVDRLAHSAVRSPSEKSSPHRLVSRIEKPLWRWKMPFSVTHPFCCVRPSRPRGGLGGRAGC